MYELSEDGDRHGDDQFLPLKGGRYKTILHGPPGTDIGDLHCDLEPYMFDSKPAVISHSGWRPSEEHVRMLEAGAHVRLAVWQHPIPPLAVSVEPPVCGCHDEAMVWDPDDGGFYCAHSSAAYGGARAAAEKDALERAHEDFTATDPDA